ncbi:fungal specific transcription factor domain-containing protein [Phlyctema vagabunda]|uniref:Fungal specific transcription factor domain-containing protein n=1 Tax=Phlyctema vagabunda TaxID=108571 RepID=A0ABR4P622_9HELO
MELSDRLSMIMINDKGSSQYIGSSSGFSLFSPRGLQWIWEKTGTSNLDKLISQVAQIDPAYFNSINLVFPIYSRELFNERFERQYSDEPPQDLAWYASFNAILALGCHAVRTEYCFANASTEFTFSPFQSDSDYTLEQKSSKYFRNVTSVFTDLQFGSPSLLGLQAMITMIFMIPCSHHPLTLHMVSATAVRLAHVIGLHRSTENPRISEEESVERRNTFWTLYIMDKAMALQNGGPPLIHDQDIGILLPESDMGITRLSKGKKIYSTFGLATKLSMIESRIHSELYSARSQTRSVSQRLKSIRELDQELLEWRDLVPIEIRPGQEIACDDHQLIPVVILHFSYYTCLTTTHRASSYGGPWTAEGEHGNLGERELQVVRYGEKACVEAARNVVDLLDCFDDESGPPMSWHVISQPMAACLILFANILQYPHDPNATSDLDRINSIVSRLGQWVIKAHLYFASATLWIFYELYKIADLHLRKTRENPGDQTSNSTLIEDDSAIGDSYYEASTPKRRDTESSDGDSDESEEGSKTPEQNATTPSQYESTPAFHLSHQDSISLQSTSQNPTPNSLDQGFNDEMVVMLDSKDPSASSFDFMPYDSSFLPMDVNWDLPVVEKDRSGYR